MLPNQVLPGFSASLWCQTGSNPTPLTLAQLGTWADQVEDIVGSEVGGTGTAGEQLKVEAVPAIGQDDASANFAVAGARQSDIIPTQSKPTSLTITAAWNPSDAGLLLMRADSESGITERTYVVAFVDGDNTATYAFNGRVSQFHIDAQPGAEAKCVFSVHPRGNMSAWSNNT